jgi:hypothetical protein
VTIVVPAISLKGAKNQLRRETGAPALPLLFAEWMGKGRAGVGPIAAGVGRRRSSESYYCRFGFQSSCEEREFMSGAQAPLARVPLAAHRDDAFRPDLFGRQHAHKADRDVADDCNRGTWLHTRRVGCIPAGAEHV